jgi:integrase
MILSLGNPNLDSHRVDTARPSAIVTRVNGQKRINLRAALDAQPHENSSVQMTFEELARAYLSVHFQGANMQLRKWIELFGQISAWEVSSEQIARAGIAMIDNGYSQSTVNRNLSQIGSVYRWAKRRLLTPVGFVSPTLSQHRYEEPIRRVTLSDEEAQRLIDGAAAEKDRRFQVLIRLAIETGARYSEFAERYWADVDLDACTIEVIDTKTGKPRLLFFSQETATLMRRVWPNRPANKLLFESDRSPGAVKVFTKPWEIVSRNWPL